VKREVQSSTGMDRIKRENHSRINRISEVGGNLALMYWRFKGLNLFVILIETFKTDVDW
jgi:hypothetical protein